MTDSALQQGGKAPRPYTDFAHTGPGTLAGRFLRSFWQPVGLSEEVPRGRAFPVRVMSEDYTLYRGAGGTAHLIGGRCAHRGTQLSTGTVEGDNVRCFYHGWAYDGTGQCVEQAIERPSFAAKVKIPSYPVHEYLGLIYAYLGEGEPPAPPRYPEFEGDVLVQSRSSLNPFNFFQSIENNCDALHLSWAHRMSNFFADNWKEGMEGGESLHGMTTGCEYEETEYGIRYTDQFSNGESKVTSFELPSVLHVKIEPVTAESGWRDLVSHIVPVDDESYIAYERFVGHVSGEAAERLRTHPKNQANYTREYQQKLIEIGDAILAGKKQLTVADVGDTAREIWLQDYIALRGQGIIADRVNEQLGRSDKAVMFMRDLWSREMARLDRGEPIKQWRWPGFVESTSGALR